MAGPLREVANGRPVPEDGYSGAYIDDIAAGVAARNPGVLDLPDDEARRLMEMGFLPGHSVTPAHAAPGGDPRVFRVDGTEFALRRDTARKLRVEGATNGAV